MKPIAWRLAACPGHGLRWSLEHMAEKPEPGGRTACGKRIPLLGELFDYGPGRAESCAAPACQAAREDAYRAGQSAAAAKVRAALNGAGVAS